MNTGLPGTGVGGLFYLVSVVVMIFIELKDYLVRKNGSKKLKLVFEQTFLACSIVIAIVATNIFFSRYVFKRTLPTLSSSPTFIQQSSYLIQVHPVIVPIILLFFVTSATQILYLVLKNRG